MDHVLPTPDPDWENPQPYDGPTDAEVAAFGRLKAAADGIRVWVAGAYTVGTTPEAWLEFGARLEALVAMCAELAEAKARTTGGEIESREALSMRWVGRDGEYVMVSREALDRLAEALDAGEELREEARRLLSEHDAGRPLRRGPSGS